MHALIVRGYRVDAVDLGGKLGFCDDQNRIDW